MDWRDFLGISKPLSEKEFLEMEIEKISKTRNSIFIVGYDEGFFSSPEYITAIQDSLERGVKIGAVFHTLTPQNTLENTIKKSGGEVFRRQKPALLSDGFRTIDKYFASIYSRAKPSQLLADGGNSYSRNQ